MKTAWKSLNGNHKWKIGKWYRVDGDLEMCSHGFHASEWIPDAMDYIPMTILAKVEVRGASIEYTDKQCWSEMRVIEAWTWTKEDAVSLSIYAARLALENYEAKHPDDNRVRNAIERAVNWLNKENAAAESAARNAAWSAESAARSAESAARSAARSAAWSAVSAAESAAESAARNAAWSAESAARSIGWSAESAAQANSCKEAWNVESAAKKKIKIKCHNWVRRRLKKKER